MPKSYSPRQARRGMDRLSRNAKNEGRRTQSSRGSNDHITVEISITTIVTLLLIVLGIFLGSKLLEVVTLIFFAFIMSSAALPLVRWFTQRGINRWIAIFTTYLLGVIIVIFSLLLIFIPFVSESQQLIADLPNISDQFIDSVHNISFAGYSLDEATIRGTLNDFVSNAGEIFASGTADGVKSALGTVVTIGGILVSAITAVLMSVYIIVDHDNFVDLLLLRIVDDKRRRRVKQLVFDVEDKLGSWLLGQTSLSFIIGAMVWAFLSILGVPFALPLAVLAGLLESIPNLGPTFSAIPAIIIGFFTGGPAVGLVVIIGYLVIQQLENSIIVPRVMSNAVGLKPIIVIISVAAGFTLAGPVGALLSVPVAVLVQIAYEFYIDLQKLKAKGIV